MSSAKTNKNYLKIFLKFLRNDNIINVSRDVLDDCLNDLDNWCKSHNQRSGRQRVAKRRKDVDRLLKPGSYQSFLFSERSRAALTLIGELSQLRGMDILSRSNFCFIRDYIMTRIFLRLGSRTGVASNFTIEEFDKAQMCDNDGVVTWDFLIDEHKTATMYDDAVMIVENDIYSYML